MPSDLQHQRNHTVSVILTVVFLAFTALYYVLFQRDLIALMQETWSRGQTGNNPVVTAVVVALVLWLVHRFVKAVTRLSGRWDAFTWLPSYLLLGLTTSIDGPTTQFHFAPWAAVLGGSVLVLLIACWLQSIMPSDKRTHLGALMLPSLVVTVCSMLLCMAVGNHDDTLHQELAAFRHARRAVTASTADETSSAVARVADVGRYSAETTPALTALRNVALARSGRLGDELFHFPQPYGSDGLDVSRFTRPTTHFGATTFYAFLGAEPYGGEDARGFIYRLYRQEALPYSRDLYAASLLLDGRLADFAALIPPPADSASVRRAPRHYREAWLLCRALNAAPVPGSYADTELQPSLDDFMSTLQNSHEAHQATLNALLLTYGRTYWYYYAAHHSIRPAPNPS